MNRYVINYKPIEDGWWLATVEGIDGCLTQGRSIKQTKERIREALGLYVNDAESAELADNFLLPSTTKKAVVALNEARRKTAEQTLVNQQATVKLAKHLFESYDLSIRDIAEIVGVSHQRIHQLLTEQHKQPAFKAQKILRG